MKGEKAKRGEKNHWHAIQNGGGETTDEKILCSVLGVEYMSSAQQIFVCLSYGRKLVFGLRLFSEPWYRQE